MTSATSALKGISSMATRLLLADLCESHEQRTGQRVEVESVGGVDAARRVQAGEAFDVVFLASDAIDKLMAGGRALAGSRVDLVHSGVAVAVREGAPVPDLGDEEAVKQVVLAARTVSYSTGPSGVALARLFERWGIATELAGRLVTPPPGVPVGSLVAKGEVELGFQQLSELIHVQGIHIVGPLPEPIQIITTFSGAVCASSTRPDAVRALLDQVWTAGRARAGLEVGNLQAMIEAEGGNFELEPHDWRHYAEKLRRAEYSIDDAALRAYFPLDRMIEAAFHVAGELFGLRFEEQKGLPVYNPDVRVFEAKDAQGRHVALFIGDYFARASKRSGAWMSAFRGQQKLVRDQRPIIVNVLNVARPPAGEPALLTIDEARTLFHEFGHALHGMLSNVTYPSLAGTAVSSDFVELPSQLYEHWLLRPEVLRQFARHAQTNEPIPDALIDKVMAARTFNQGFATVEFCASAFVDLEMHLEQGEGVSEPLAFERRVLETIGMPREIIMRHRSPHFSHIFSGEGYASGYYSYLWSEVLDADAFAAFEETGDIFHPETAKRLHDFVYSAGNLRDPKEAYTAFRGRLPTPDALLEKRGLV